MNLSPKKPRLTAVEHEAFTSKVVDRYLLDDAPIRQIAAETGWSYGGIHRILVSTGVELRSRGGSHTRSVP